MAGKLSAYDPAEVLANDETVAIVMAEAFHTNDVDYIAHALGIVPRAQCMVQIASQTGLSREQLYRSFSENGNPTVKTTLAVMKALGVELRATLPAAGEGEAVRRRGEKISLKAEERPLRCARAS